MKKGLFVFLFVLLLSSTAFAQIEAGDKEISFMGYYTTFIGEDVGTNGFGSLQLSYSSFVNKFLQLGVAPTLSFSTIEDQYGEPEVDIQISGSVFFNLNMAVSSRTVPYLTGQFYQFTFDIPEGREFTDYSYVNVGLGVKNFFNEYAAFNTLVTYGFSIAEEATGGILIIMTGLSFLF